MADFDALSVREALDASIQAADHLEPRHAGIVAAARALADKIDAWDVIVQWAVEDAGESGRRPAVPQNDNTSPGTYLKYLEQLGLTVLAVKPTARTTKNMKPEPGPEPAPAADPRASRALRMLGSAGGKVG